MTDETRRVDRSPTPAPGLGPRNRGCGQGNTDERAQVEARTGRAMWIVMSDHVRKNHPRDWGPILDLYLAARRGELSLREIADQLAIRAQL